MLRTVTLSLVAAVALGSRLGAQAGPAKPPVDVDRIDLALAQRVEGKAPADDVRIEASWRRGTEIVSSRLYGTGVGIWRERVQFPITREQFLGLLRDLRQAHFGAMPKVYGSEEGEGEESEEEREREREKEKVYLRGFLAVRVGTEVKRVAQYMEGDQDKAFASLVERILAVGEKASAKGVGAASLAEGLAAVADGKLAPETLQILAQRRAGRPGEGGDAAAGSWILRIDGRRVLARPLSSAQPEPPRLLVLSEPDFHTLATLLRESDLAGLPRNLYSPEYVRLNASVLDRHADLTARRYAGKTATSLGAKQETFDRVVAALTALRDRTVKEGAKVPEGTE